VSPLRYAHNQATPAQLLAHLQAADASFMPPLSQRVALPEYAAKLQAQAERHEAWAGEELVGLIASYCNRPEAGAYISNVSLLPAWRGQGVADELLRRCLQQARQLGLQQAALHLHRDNHPAQALYRRHGFQPGLADGDSLPMTLNLNTPAP
jgi:ribosomal-protein-alanine N-acetyltransferase